MARLNQSDALESEVRAVFYTLEEAIDELYPPLGELVRERLTKVFTPVRAAIILAAARDTLDTAELRDRRIYLASALEMLHLALDIHNLLMANSPLRGDEDAEKSRVGSVILAGDYCFSRSAILAARTDNPQVVKQFAHGLKIVSERRLRRLFKPSETSQEEQVLIEVGLAAAMLLANQDPAWTATINELGQQILLAATNQQFDATRLTSLLHQLPPLQQARWQALLNRYTLVSTMQQ